MARIGISRASPIGSATPGGYGGRFRGQQQERRRAADADHPHDRLGAQAGVRPRQTRQLFHRQIRPANRQRLAMDARRRQRRQRTNGNKPITWNDPNDANFPTNSAFQQAYIQHLTNRWGSSTNGGVRYYLMDNEHSIWHSTHQDVHPVGRDHAGNPRQVLRLRRGGQSPGPQRAGAGAGGMGLVGLFLQRLRSAESPGIPSTAPPMAAGTTALAAEPVPPARHQHQPAAAGLFHRCIAIRRAAKAAAMSPPPRNCCATAPRASSGTPTTWMPVGSAQQPTNNILMLIPRMKGWVASLLSRHQDRHHRIQLGRRGLHQRRHRPGGHPRHLRPRGPRPGHPLDRPRRQHTHLQSDEDVSQLRRQQIRLRRHQRRRHGAEPGQCLGVCRRALLGRRADGDGDQQTAYGQRHRFRHHQQLPRRAARPRCGN